MTNLAVALCAQVLLSFQVEGDGPVRFGFPVPMAALQRGLRIDGTPGARLQWSLLQEAPGCGEERLWAEIAVLGQRGRARLVVGGDPPTGAAGGALLAVTRAVRRDELAERRTIERRWADGSVDRIERAVLIAGDAERDAGEAATTIGEEGLGRRLRVRIAASAWRAVGVLPPADGSGAPWRRAVRDAVDHLPAAPGARGRGDYSRGADRDVVTNLEFDTTLGFANLALCDDDPALLRRAWESARHLADVDIDRRSGLPFRHGPDHRSAPPELGHVWIGGLLRVALLFGDRDLIDDALTMGRSLAARARGRAAPQGPGDRMRDEAWPLFELEGLLRFVDLPPLRAGADAAARALLARWDPGLGAFRYGEGETRSPELLKDRVWLTAGIALPALRRYAERTGDTRVATVVAAVDRRVAAVLMDGGRGVPLQVMVGPRGAFDASRAEGAAEAYLLLDGLDTALRRRSLGRSAVRAGLDGALDRGHDDLATRFSLAARCSWILR